MKRQSVTDPFIFYKPKLMTELINDWESIVKFELLCLKNMGKDQVPFKTWNHFTEKCTFPVKVWICQPSIWKS